jgi:hypothetical protein
MLVDPLTEPDTAMEMLELSERDSLLPTVAEEEIPPVNGPEEAPTFAETVADADLARWSARETVTVLLPEVVVPTLTTCPFLAHGFAHPLTTQAAPCLWLPL